MNKLLVHLILIILLIYSCGTPNIPVRDFLESGNDPREGYGAYGYIVFTHRPNESEKERYLKVCESFLNEIQDINEYPDYNQKNLMVTFWLHDHLLNAKNGFSDCQKLIEHYDYPRAQIITASIDKENAAGPILVAWTSPSLLNNTSTSRLILDMTNFSNDDIQRAFRIWKDRISRKPELWNNGFVVQTIVEEFRSLINKYGQTIVDIFNG